VRNRVLIERAVAAALLASGVVLPVAALARRKGPEPTELLFVARGCPHCQAAAARFDSAAARLRVRALLVVDSGSWSRVAPHVPVARDAEHLLARALGIRAVPAFVSVIATVHYR
jgi:hypothetical protein